MIPKYPEQGPQSSTLERHSQQSIDSDQRAEYSHTQRRQVLALTVLNITIAQQHGQQ